MIIGKYKLYELVRRRLPSLSGPATSEYVNIVLDLIIERLCSDEQPVIIDNFGILCRRKLSPRRVRNITTKEHIYIITNSIFLRPSYAFSKFYKDKESRYVMKQRIVKKCQQIMKERKGKHYQNII